MLLLNNGVTQGKQETFLILQVFRGLAALAVLLSHIEAICQRTLGRPFSGGIYEMGPLGVDFFFVLSGFIIFHIHRRDIGNPGALPKYLVKRTLRIYPLLMLVTLAKGLYILLGGPGIPVEKFNSSSVFSSLFLLPTDSMMIIDVAWTLRHEMFFYVLFGIAILYGKRAALLLTIGGILLVLSTYWIAIPSQEYLMRFVLSPFNLEFIMGILVALCWGSFPMKRAIYPIILSIGLILMGFFLIEGRNGASDLNYHLLWGSIFSLIVLGGVGTESHYPLKVPKGLCVLGDGSYSVYLVHSSVQVAVFMLAIKFMPPGFVLTDFYLYIFAAISLIIGLAVWFMIEKPMLRISQKYVFNAYP